MANENEVPKKGKITIEFRREDGNTEVRTKTRKVCIEDIIHAEQILHQIVCERMEEEALEAIASVLKD